MHNPRCWFEDYLYDLASSSKSERFKQLFEKLSEWAGRLAVKYMKSK